MRNYGPLPPGGLPVQKKTRPNVPYRDFRGNLVARASLIEENDEMKFKQIAAVATLTMGAAACNAATPVSGSADTNNSDERAQAHKTETSSANPSTANRPSSGIPGKELGPLYKEGMDYIDFRNQLIADGWKPVVNPNCGKEAPGDIDDELCKKNTGNTRCKVCEMLPEIYIAASNGLVVTRFMKNGIPLSITAYGDYRNLHNRNRQGLNVLSWDFVETK